MDRIEAFGILGVEAGANAEEIDRAFKAQAFIAHPDYGGTSPELSRLVEARDCLRSSGDCLTPVPVGELAVLVHQLGATSLQLSEHKERREDARDLARTATTRAVSPLLQSRRACWVAATLSGVVAALLLLSTRAADLVDYSGPAIGAGFAAVAALLAVVGIVLKYRADAVQQAVDEAIVYLSNKSDYADLLHAYLGVTEECCWSLSELGDSLCWGVELYGDNIGPASSEKGRYRSLLRRAIEPTPKAQTVFQRMEELRRIIRNDDFARLFVMKGLEHGTLVEVPVREERVLRVKYALA